MLMPTPAPSGSLSLRALSAARSLPVWSKSQNT
jgi:hypothetical protein